MARPEQITLARRLLSDLAEMSEDLPGVTREAYGVREQRAHDLIREEAERLGCVVHVDAVGKLYMTHSGGGSEPQALLVGLSPRLGSAWRQLRRRSRCCGRTLPNRRTA